jgi:thiamine biosynthesis protein ThiI
MPVFRPLIGLDKNDIVEMARDIGTFDTSILPYEDCCTVFTPKRPATKPRLEKVVKYQSLLDCEKLIDEAVAGVETIIV